MLYHSPIPNLQVCHFNCVDWWEGIILYRIIEFTHGQKLLMKRLWYPYWSVKMLCPFHVLWLKVVMYTFKTCQQLCNLNFSKLADFSHWNIYSHFEIQPKNLRNNSWHSYFHKGSQRLIFCRTKLQQYPMEKIPHTGDTKSLDRCW